MGFRPTAPRDIAVTGVHVTETGVDYDRSPRQSFTLLVSTTGAVRYVDSSELDHVGFLRYAVGTSLSVGLDRGTAQSKTTSALSPRGGFLHQDR